MADAMGWHLSELEENKVYEKTDTIYADIYRYHHTPGDMDRNP
jgi:hypothetical protein